MKIIHINAYLTESNKELIIFMATNQFLPFGTASDANLTPLNDWVNDTNGIRSTGNVPNAQTSSALNNRALRQASLIAAAFGKLCADNNIDMLDTGNISDVTTALSSLFLAYSSGGGGGGGTVSITHNSTTNRDAPDAHPMSAITGLQTALNSLVKWSDTESTLSGSSTKIPTSAALYQYINNYSVAATWGSITGTITSQTDLMTYINAYNATLNGKVTGATEITAVKVFATEAAATTYSAQNPTVLCFYPLS